MHCHAPSVNLQVGSLMILFDSGNSENLPQFFFETTLLGPVDKKFVLNFAPLVITLVYFSRIVHMIDKNRFAVC